MKITIEQAAQWFQNRAMDTPMPATKEMFHLAAEALYEKAERENPRPLTLEELQQTDGEPVFVRDMKTGRIFCAIAYPNFIYDQIGWLNDETYGSAWVAYRYKPKGARE